MSIAGSSIDFGALNSGSSSSGQSQLQKGSQEEFKLISQVSNKSYLWNGNKHMTLEIASSEKVIRSEVIDHNSAANTNSQRELFVEDEEEKRHL